MPGTIFLEGESVSLRTIEEEDLKFIIDNINSSEIRPWVSHRGPNNIKQETKFFHEEISQDNDTDYFLICREEQPIGFVCLKEKWKDSKLAEIEIWITPNEHGNGYGTDAARLITNYAINELNIHKIVVLVAGNNPQSETIWKKLGYNQEGNLKNAAYIKGEYRNIKYYGITQKEWQENEKTK